MTWTIFVVVEECITPVSKSTKFSYLLPSRHTLITLIVLAALNTQLHGGVDHTVIALRQKFLHKCVLEVHLGAA